MIDWTFAISLAIGVTVGTEIARRRAASTGRVFCFQPLWLYYCQLPAWAVIGVLFHDSAISAVASPKTETVWMLIGSAITMFVLLAVHAETEIRLAKRKLHALESVTDGQN